MIESTPALVEALNREFIGNYPREAALALAGLDDAEAAEALAQLGENELAALWPSLPVDRAERMLVRAPAAFQQRLLAHADPVASARVLRRIKAEPRAELLAALPAARRKELDALLAHATDTAGAIMDPRPLLLHADQTVAHTLQRIRDENPSFTGQLFVVDGDGVLQKRVELRDLALAPPEQALAEIARPVTAVVQSTASREEVAAAIERTRLTDLPVVDFSGRLAGVIRYEDLVATVQDESSADLLTMVGASREERALSSAAFAVRKRLPWLEINLVTAFLAASVVGLFEGTIAKFTALAVLLPVVAGQSGNSGAQALAVTMRGLALREISASHWPRVARKELGAGLVNGLLIALTTAAGVYIWSGSFGLGLVIALAMVTAMTAAGFAGAIIPVVLTAVGQDPAQSSSIILTTVTDIVGFFAFLGIATVLSGML